MGRISRILKIKGDKGTKDINVIFDSGATRSVKNRYFPLRTKLVMLSN